MIDWLGVSRTILVNTTSRAEKTPKELQALYDYLEREEVAENDPFIKRLHAIVQTTNQNREVRSIMTLAEEMENREAFARECGLKEGRKQGHDAGLKEGHDAGLREGSIQAKEEIALKLKASGMSETDIAEITGLSLERISAL